MEESKKFYSQRSIAIATYFGGPLAAGYLVKKNFESLEQPENAKKALLIGIISTIILFAGIFSIPEPIIDKIPQALIPAIYTLVIYLIVEKFHGEVLKQHKETGGRFYSGWKATGIGLIAMIIILAFVGTGAFLAGDFSNTNADFDTTTYDKGIAKFGENENNALKVFNILQTAESGILIKEFSNGLVLWNENKKIVEDMNKIKNLPIELKQQNDKLIEYCNLRIKHNNLIISAISEDTDKYSEEIVKIGLEINKIMEALN